MDNDTSFEPESINDVQQPTVTKTSSVEYTVFSASPEGLDDCPQSIVPYLLARESSESDKLYILLEKDLLAKICLKYCQDTGTLIVSPVQLTDSDDEPVVWVVNGGKSFVRKVFGTSTSVQNAFKILKDRGKSAVLLSQIREVRRLGKKTVRLHNVVNSTLPEQRECTKYRIFYGDEFMLQVHEIWALSPEGEEMAESVWKWREHFMQLPYQFHVLALAKRTFHEYLQKDKQTISASCCKKICIRLGNGYRLTTMVDGARVDKFSEDFNSFSSNGEMNFDGFFKLFRCWLSESTEKILSYCFQGYKPEDEETTVLWNDKEVVLSSDVETNNNDEAIGECIFFQEKVSKEDFIDHLFSSNNSIWNPSRSKVYQDMTQPLWKYWVSSSHNTYLSGHQLLGYSTVEAYIRCMGLGSRCVELDCWDGRNGKPIIKHGWTLTTKISFVSVIEAIKEHGFKKSQYPLILSIENHCSPSQQEFMAKKLVEILGDQLQHAEEGDQIRSPEDLKGKVLLKCKVGGSAEAKNDPDLIYDKRKVYLMNNGKWEEYIMGLSDEGLKFQKIPKIHRYSVGESSAERCDELHELEKWYHGNVQPAEAHELIQKYGKEGCFLVRKSSKIDCYVLVFLHDNRVRDFRIHHDNRTYYFEKSAIFDSLFSLIVHYEKHPIKSQKFTLAKLGEAVPVQRNLDYSSEPWFHKELNRQQAEKILRKMPIEGFDSWFLVRNAGTNAGPNKYVVSFQCKDLFAGTGTCFDGKTVSEIPVFVKHCKIRFDGCHFVVADRRFESLTNLIEHYKKHPFYKGSKLKDYPSSEKCAELLAQPDDQFPLDIPLARESNCYIYTTDANALILKVKATRDYQKPQDPDALSFRAGDIIYNVNPDDDDDTTWCRGDCNGMIQKRFPISHVEECDATDTLQRTKVAVLRLQDIPLGKAKIERYKAPDNNETPYMNLEKELKIRSHSHGRDARPHKLKKGSTSTKKIGEANTAEHAEGHFPNLVQYILTIKGCETKIGVRDKEEAEAWKKSINDILRRQGTCIKRGFCQTIPRAVIPNKPHTGLEKLVYLPGSSYNNNHDAKGETNYGSVRRTSQKSVTSMKNSEVEKAARHNVGANILPSHGDSYLWRTYPSAMDSSNYDPTLHWSIGVQLVALNFQTADKWMGLNQGKFLDNGNCGYVLKPNYLQTQSGLKDADPSDISSELISFSVIAARFLTRNGEKVTNPFVSVEILGTRSDMDKKLTRLAEDNNGLNPFWGETFYFCVTNPEIAQVRFTLSDKDSFQDSHFIGQATFPLKCLRTGIRSVRLQTNFGEDLKTPSVLLVRHRRQPVQLTKLDSNACPPTAGENLISDYVDVTK